MIKTQKTTFTGQETIADILSKFPEAQEVFNSYNLGCSGCHINVYETLQQGVMAHGMNDQDLKKIIKDLETAAKEVSLSPHRKIDRNPILTQYASQKIREFQIDQEKLHWGFKIEVLENPIGEISYALDFLERPEKNDTVLEMHEIKLFLSPESLNLLKNCEIDFIETEDDAGFKIEKKY
jgi:hybrid cluster-associated redox disulfide protein